MTETINSSRRAMIAGGAAAAAFAAAGAASANSLNPAPKRTTVDRDGRFAGKTIVVTGGNSGIGAASVEAFALEGGRVVFGARRDALGRAVEARIQAAGGDVAWVQTDVREPEQVERLLNVAVERYDRLDVLFNNAGVFMTPNLIEDVDLENFDDMMRTNVHGVFYGMKYAVPLMKAQGGGVIVNMASVAGHRGFPNTAHYTASKHAVIGLTKAGAQLAKDNIRVASISPLAVDTPMLRESFAHQGLTYEAMAPNFVTPRIMAPSEMAQGVLFLASDAATAFNGTDFDATGGQLA